MSNDQREQRGFAMMDPTRQREIARMGGKAAHVKGTAHEWSGDEARIAGRLGGQASQRNRASRMKAETPVNPEADRRELPDE
jgi:general stress protein YciG